MRRTNNFISALFDKQTLKTFLPNDPICSYFPPLQLDITNVIKATTKERVCYVFGEDFFPLSAVRVLGNLWADVLAVWVSNL